MQLQDMNDQKRVFISMIVPVYNVEPYIKECFDSIAAQTYEGRMECIFVDDCGQDDSMALLSECVGSYEALLRSALSIMIEIEGCRLLATQASTRQKAITCSLLIAMTQSSPIV